MLSGGSLSGVYTATAVVAAIDVADRKVAIAAQAVKAAARAEQKEEHARHELTRALAEVKQRLRDANERAAIYGLTELPAVVDVLMSSKRAIESGG